MSVAEPFKRTKIICTLGPSVDDEDVLFELMSNGMDIARLNFSHGSHEEHKARIERLKRVRERADLPCAIMLDTMGPEIRTGLLKEGRPVDLEEGSDSFLRSISSRVTRVVFLSHLPSFLKLRLLAW